MILFLFKIVFVKVNSDQIIGGSNENKKELVCTKFLQEGQDEMTYAEMRNIKVEFLLSATNKAAINFHSSVHIFLHRLKPNR